MMTVTMATMDWKIEKRGTEDILEFLFRFIITLFRDLYMIGIDS